MAGYPTKPGEEKVWPRDARFKACPAACSKDGEHFSDHVLPAMYDLYPGACTNVPSVPKDHPHEATGDLGDLGGLGDLRARSRRWRPAGGLDLIGMSRFGGSQAQSTPTSSSKAALASWSLFICKPRSAALRTRACLQLGEL